MSNMTNLDSLFENMKEAPKRKERAAIEVTLKEGRSAANWVPFEDLSPRDTFRRSDDPFLVSYAECTAIHTIAVRVTICIVLGSEIKTLDGRNLSGDPYVELRAWAELPDSTYYGAENDE